MNNFIDMKQKCDVLFNNYKKTNNKKYVEDIWILISKYAIASMYKKFSSFSYLDFEYGDFVSLSYISLIKSLESTICDNGFLYFYFKNLKWICSNYLRGFSSNKHKILNLNYFVNKDLTIDENNISDLNATISEQASIEYNLKKEEYFNILKSIIYKVLEIRRRSFTKLEIDIIRKLIDGETLDYIAKKHNMSLSAVESAYKKAKQKVKRFAMIYKKYLEKSNLYYGINNMEIIMENFV